MFPFCYHIYVKFGITKGSKYSAISSSVDWNFIFQGKTGNQKVNILNEYLLNVFHNFIPDKK